MAQIFVRQAQSPKAKSRKKKIRFAGGVVLPKTFLVIWHNQHDDKVVIKHQSMVCNEDCQHPNSLITAVNLSEVSVYFCFLPMHEQMEAYTQLINLIAKTSHQAISEQGGKLLPSALKRFYVRAMKFFRGLSAGSFVTDVFIKKVLQLVRTIWRHGQNYLDYSRRNLAANTPAESLELQSATPYIC
ncbi:hypothetical protein IPM19_00450 [bacterium]|nr:MAG: hypothetical protein IPM19_00450 [bacterium]